MPDEVVDPAERLERLMAQQAPQFAAGFALLVAQIKSSVDLNDIADLISRGDLESALTQVLRRAPALGSLYLNSFVAAAQDTAAFLNRSLSQIVVDFDQANPFVVRVMQEERLRMVREFTQQQREATRQALARGVAEGANPIQQARNFRDSIGLTAKQEAAVAKYRQLLEKGDRAIFDRALRDKRFDRTIQAAIRDGKPLTQTQVERMVQRYRDRYIKYRAEVIARTEALRSVHAGKEAMYQQAIEAGELDPNNMTEEWNTARDERVRDSHSAMHGQLIPYGQMFVSGRGNATRHPGGFGVASEDIQCRCAVGTRIVQISVPQGLSVSILS